MSDYVIPLPDGGEWVVRAFEYPTADEARGVWEQLEETSRGTEANHSLWRTTNPEGTLHLVIVVGRPKDLPEIEGMPFELDKRSAKDFALRRARRGLDAVEEGLIEHLEEVFRYGDKPVTIDSATGHVKPYRRRERT